VVLVAGFAIRFPLTFVHGYVVDILHWETLSKEAYLGGVANIYRLSLENPNIGVYPPVYYYALTLVGFVYRHLFSPAYALRTQSLNVLIKLFPVLGDCVLGALAYVLVRRMRDARAGLLAATALLFNPAIVYNSAYWGMFGDSVYTALVLAALLAASQDRVAWAWAAITLGVWFKPQAAAFVPLVAWATWQPLELARFLKAGLVGLAVTLLVWLPFIVGGTLPQAVAALRQTVGLFPYLSANAHNVWYFFTAGNSWVSDAEPLIGPLSPRALGLLAFGAAYALALLRLRRSKEAPILPAAAYVAFAFYMLSTEMHENYIYPAIALLAAAWPLSRRVRTLAVALTLTALVTMVLHDPPIQGSLEGPPYIALISATVVNSGVNLLIFVLWTGALLTHRSVTRAMEIVPQT
jgi:Gpi18-like mannosyltransferase